MDADNFSQALDGYVPEHEFTPEMAALFDVMSEVSEDAYCASWIHGNEFFVWNILHPYTDKGYAPHGIAQEELQRIKELEAGTKGWIVWIDNQEIPGLPVDLWGPYFVSREMWEDIFERHVHIQQSRNA